MKRKIITLLTALVVFACAAVPVSAAGFSESFYDFYHAAACRDEILDDNDFLSFFKSALDTVVPAVVFCT